MEVSLPQVAAFFRQHQQHDEHQAAASVCVGPSFGPSYAGSHGSAGGGDVDAGCCRSDGGHTGVCGGAAKGSPEPGLVQQSLSQVWLIVVQWDGHVGSTVYFCALYACFAVFRRSQVVCKVVTTQIISRVRSRQMFRNSSADRGTIPIDDTVNERAASVIQGTNGRTALQLLSQGGAGRTSPRDNAKTPDALTDVVPRRQGGSLRCHKGGVLVSEPGGAQGDRPRRVFVRANCHLHHTSAALSSDCGGAPTTSSGVSADCWHSRTTLFEVPRGWALGEGVSEGEGRWVAGDGLVYAPLCCSCSGCRSAQVGEKAVGAGLCGQDLIGRSWFYSIRVQADGIVDETSPKELVLPAQVAVDRAPSLTNPAFGEA